MGRVIHKPSAQRIKFESAIADIDKLECKVGWFDSARYPDGTSVAYVATIQEFGDESHKIPPRPTMRPTIVAQGAAWSSLMAKGSLAAVEGKETARSIFEKLGLQASGDVRRAIATLTAPALSPLTIAIRAYKRDIRVYGPQPKFTGKTVGQVAGMMKKNELDVSGVSTKPLIFSSLMFVSLTYAVEVKS